MDNLHTQPGGPPLPEGHDDSDLNIRGVVWFGVFLAVGGVVSFLLMIAAMWGLEKWEKDHEAKLTPVQQQLQAERDKPRDRGKESAAEEENRAPDWYGRGQIEEQLRRTFATPRLQYRDDHDMNSFREAEDKWLESTGKNANGNVHIPVNRAMELLVQQGLPPVSGPFLPANASAPSAAIPDGGVASQPVRAPRGGANR